MHSGPAAALVGKPENLILLYHTDGMKATRTHAEKALPGRRKSI